MVMKALGGILNLGILPIVVLFLVTLFASDYLGPVLGAGDTLGGLIGGLVPLDGAEGAGDGAFGGDGLVTLFLGVLMGRFAGFFGGRD